MRTRAPRPIISYHPFNPDEVTRVDAIARYAGTTRADLVRRAVAHFDSTLVLDELDRLEQGGAKLTAEQLAVREEATATRDEMLAACRPRPLIPVSPN